MRSLSAVESGLDRVGIATLGANLAPSRTHGVYLVGDIIALKPDVYWQIERGAVRVLTWTDEGTPVALGYWGEGDIISYALLGVQPCQIECLKITEIKRVFPSVVDTSQAMLSQALQAQELLAIIRCERAYLRLFNFLIWLTKKFGNPIETGLQIELKITHQEIAEAIGIARVTVTRLLQKFENEGLILRPAGKTIVIKDT